MTIRSEIKHAAPALFQPSPLCSASPPTPCLYHSSFPSHPPALLGGGGVWRQLHRILKQEQSCNQVLFLTHSRGLGLRDGTRESVQLLNAFLLHTVYSKQIVCFFNMTANVFCKCKTHYATYLTLPTSLQGFIPLYLLASKMQYINVSISFYCTTGRALRMAIQFQGYSIKLHEYKCHYGCILL